MTGKGSLDGSDYHCDFFNEVRVQAIIIWPQCFVDGMYGTQQAWRHVMGQIEAHSQSNWRETRGEALFGMRDCNGITIA